MTKPEERANLINSLLILWEQVPHLRFCQLVADINRGSDGFYVEDSLFLKRLEEFQEVVTLTKNTKS